MIRRTCLSLVLIALALPAFAADGPPDGKDPNSKSYLLGDYASKQRGVPPTTAGAHDPSLIHRQAERWPWLEAGTVVCSTEDDLQRYHAVIAARLNGQPAAGGAAACRRLTQRTQIDIAARRGPATTEILLNSDARQAGLDRCMAAEPAAKLMFEHKARSSAPGPGQGQCPWTPIPRVEGAQAVRRFRRRRFASMEGLPEGKPPAFSELTRGLR